MLKFEKPKSKSYGFFTQQRDELCRIPVMRVREEDEEEKEKVMMRVKVKMTKQEAARLISKCKAGGVLDFKDAAHELVKLPMDRVSVVSNSGGRKAVLKTIPEEF